jgi:hypothetical protein
MTRLSTLLLALSAIHFCALADTLPQLPHEQLHPLSPVVRGRCANGSTYELQKYSAEIRGKTLLFYAYNGPLGRGIVQSSVNQQMAINSTCKDQSHSMWLADDGIDQ